MIQLKLGGSFGRIFLTFSIVMQEKHRFMKNKWHAHDCLVDQ